MIKKILSSLLVCGFLSATLMGCGGGMASDAEKQNRPGKNKEVDQKPGGRFKDAITGAEAVPPPSEGAMETEQP